MISNKNDFHICVPHLYEEKGMEVKMKKYLALLLVLALSLSLVLTGCGGDTADDGNDQAEVTQNEENTEDNVDEEQPVDEEAPEVMSYEEYMAAEYDTEVTVETYVQAKQSWWEDTATLYTQDEDGAYFIYSAACSEDDYALLEVGTKIRVTGYKSVWSGEIEIIDGTFEIIDDGDTYVAEPIDVTEMLGTDGLIDYQNQLVTFTGMTVEDSGDGAAFLYSYDGSGTDGDDLYFNVSYNGQIYTFTVESYLCDNTTDVYAAVKNLQVGDVVNMEGFLYWYEGVNPHITSVEVVTE